jgi:hypothetical protein
MAQVIDRNKNTKNAYIGKKIFNEKVTDTTIEDPAVAPVANFTPMIKQN